MIDERAASFARAGHDVNHAIGQPDLLENFGEMKSGDRSGLRRLQDTGVSASKRGRQLPRRHQQREIPGNDLSGDAEWPRFSAWESVFQFVGPACVIEKMCRYQRQIDVARFLDSFAAVHGFEHGQLARLFLDQARYPKKVFSTLAARHLRPDIFVSASRRFYREINILFSCGSDLRQFFFRGRIYGVEILS